MLLSGKSVTFYDIEDPDEKWDLNTEKLLKGIELTLKNDKLDVNDIDVDDADLIFQYALFEEIVYC